MSFPQEDTIWKSQLFLRWGFCCGGFTTFHELERIIYQAVTQINIHIHPHATLDFSVVNDMDMTQDESYRILKPHKVK